MRILQVNQYNYPRGGADKYFLDLSESLANLGHEVAKFSMKHPKNLASKYEKYFVSRVSFNESLGVLNKIKIPFRVLYSFEAKRKFKKLLNDFKPEVIHLHNIYHHISPSILDVASKKKIPVLMHLHDYKLICPNHAMFVRGKICDSCCGSKYYNCLKKKCVKNSFFGSLLATIEMYFHHKVLKIYEKKVSLFIAPSRFMKETCVRFGQNKKQIEVVYNPYNSKLKEDSEVKIGNYLLYFGRLSEEKGIKVLIEALSQTKESLKIAGEGEEKKNIEEMAKRLNLPVEFLGNLDDVKLKSVIRDAKAIVMPSIWLENMPLSLMESLSMKKVVIASSIGGFPEIIKNTENGFLFEMGNSSDLAGVINSLSSYDLLSISKKAGETAEQFQPAKNIEYILSLYNKVLSL